ncbi:MAG: DUF2779 domain-containing protein [Planctomycetes bacterium]|nr:DUF2779 domain-containing protein [Planctomycetota bacterium]
MKKSDKPQGDRNLDKHLFEAGQQCHKRLWLDYHEPSAERPSPRRQQMSRIGDEMRELARTAFPKGVAIEGPDIEAAASATRQHLDDGVPVLFDAAFVADGLEVVCDILVVHKDDRVDLFEIKSGTKVKHRYVNDLAMQAIVLEKCGYKMQRAYLLHINPKYTHQAGEDYPPMQLLRSADVTAKVQKQQPNVARKLQNLKLALENDGALELPMGTFCERPFPCPHRARCRKTAPPLPLHLLPELTRQQELELHKEGIEELLAVPPDREDLSFRQRRTLQCQLQQQRIVEPFVAEELDESERPLHFLAIATITDPLPRFDMQRPWQQTPYAWAAKTIHEDGRVELQSFVQVDRDDPRGAFVKSLARHLEVGGTAIVWGDEAMRELRNLLDSVPDDKASVRALLGQDHLDMRGLFESGVFDPGLLDYAELTRVTGILLGDDSGKDLEAMDADARFELVHKARAPRVRAATREKIGAAITEALAWQADRLADLFAAFKGSEEQPTEPADEQAAPKVVSRASKPLPKLPE